MYLLLNCNILSDILIIFKREKTFWKWDADVYRKKLIRIRGFLKFHSGFLNKMVLCISELCHFLSGNFSKVRLGLLWHHSWYNEGPVLRLECNKGTSAVARTDLGNCTLGKFPLGKIPLGSFHFGKCYWESILNINKFCYGSYKTSVCPYHRKDLQIIPMSKIQNQAIAYTSFFRNLLKFIFF